MTLSAVAVGDAVQATLQNELISNVNGSPGRAVFTANGVWSVPPGVHRFKVSLVGGGGYGGQARELSDGFNVTSQKGSLGGSAPLISAIISGQDVGTSFTITVGAGGSAGSTTGGTTSFGTLMQSTGGGVGGIGDTGIGSPGTATFPPGAPAFYHANALFGAAYYDNVLVGYGTGGQGGVSFGPPPGNGQSGLVVIEW